MLTDAMDFFNCKPNNDLLSEREVNEAYCIACPPKEYAVYFPNDGTVKLNIGTPRKITIRWLDILESKWKEPIYINEKSVITLQCPDKEYRAVLIK